MDDNTEQDREIMQNKIINEEYKIWKKNSVFLYDIMYSRALEWPTLTVQWLPDVREVPGKPYRNHRLILGTHTSGQQPEYLQIAQFNLPNPPGKVMDDWNEANKELGGHGGAKEPLIFNVIQKITHPGEVNKARYQPQNPNLIATWAPNSNIYLWDRTKHSSIPGPEPKPQAVLQGHSKEGFALEWSPFTEGQLLSGSEDNSVCLWDVKRDYRQNSQAPIKPARRFNHHSATVNDVQYHPHYGKNFFGSVSDDLTMCFYDMRSKSDSDSRPAVRFDKAHSDAINSLSFNPRFETLFATGSADKTVGIFDLRYPSHGKVHNMEGHKSVVTKVEWHPTDCAILASCSDDRRTIFWDVSRIGNEQTPEDAEDGPPEILFMHGGHTNRVSDFSWNKNDPWVMCTTGEENLIQIWRASSRLVESLPPNVKVAEVEDRA